MEVSEQNPPPVLVGSGGYAGADMERCPRLAGFIHDVNRGSFDEMARTSYLTGRVHAISSLADYQRRTPLDDGSPRY